MFLNRINNNKRYHNVHYDNNMSKMFNNYNNIEKVSIILKTLLFITVIFLIYVIFINKPMTPYEVKNHIFNNQNENIITKNCLNVNSFDTQCNYVPSLIDFDEDYIFT